MAWRNLIITKAAFSISSKRVEQFATNCDQPAHSKNINLLNCWYA